MDNKEDSNAKLVRNTRRGFFQFLLSETICLFEEIRGKPQMRLSELDQVPDNLARKTIPILNKTCPYRIEGDRLLVKNKKPGMPDAMQRLNSREIYIIGRFDGHHTLDDIGRLLEHEFGQDREQAYQQVKSLFTSLAKRMICHPADAYEHNEKGTSS